MPTAIYLVNWKASNTATTIIKDILYDPNYSAGTPFQPDALANLYAERINRSIDWEGAVWNVLYGTNPAPRSKVKTFPGPNGPVYFQFYIPPGAKNLNTSAPVTGGFAAQFPNATSTVPLFPVGVSTPPTTAVAPLVTNIIRNSDTLGIADPNLSGATFYISYIIVLG